VGIDRSCAERCRLDCVVVDSTAYTVAGFVCCAVGALGLVSHVAVETAPWCAAELSAFRDVMLVALAVDVAGVQPLIAGLVHAWRWVSHEAAEEDDDADDASSGEDEGERRAATSARGAGCLTVPHELHPIAGQWRYVGPLFVVPDV
jgi:hypothetical protein